MTQSTPGYGITFSYICARNFWAMGIAMPIACILLTFLHFYTRRLRNVYIGWDDAFSIIALIGIIGMGVCFCWGAAYKVFGYPTRPANMSEEEAYTSDTPAFRLLQKLGFVVEEFMLLTYGCIKLSIVCFCRRLFLTHKKSKFGIISLGLAWLIGIWMVALICLYIVTCPYHFDANWGSLYTESYECNSLLYNVQWEMASTDLFLDIVVWCLPLPLIWQLKLSITSKLSLTAVFLVGIVAIAASVARLVLYDQILYTAGDPKEDVWLTIVTSLYWSFLETGISFIAATLPTLNSLVRDQRFKILLRKTLSIMTLGKFDTLVRQTEDVGSVNISPSLTDGLPRARQYKSRVRTELSSIAVVE